ncbi:unannotated protein [freshwater metagenome]|uniref:Unannotated protein n=1 Tax=freshwater metagenome TaxID=449393 RepID=A0A6J7K8B6_9ZZZZ
MVASSSPFAPTATIASGRTPLVVSTTPFSGAGQVSETGMSMTASPEAPPELAASPRKSVAPNCSPAIARSSAARSFTA